MGITIFVLVFFVLIAGAVFYTIWYSKNRFDISEHDASNLVYQRTSTRIKDTGSGHGFHTPYGGASSNGAASSYVARTRKRLN